MKFLFAAPVTFNRITSFISSYITGLAQSAKDLGHEVKVLQTTDTEFSQRTLDLLNRYNGNALQAPEIQKSYIFRNLRKHLAFFIDYPNDLYLSQQISEEAEEFKPDVVFIYLINTYDLSGLIKDLRKKGIKVVTWLGLHPAKVQPGIHKILKNCDHIFLYDKSYIEYYEKKLDITNTHMLPLGCNVAYYDSINPDDDFIKNNNVNICFAGMFDKRRKALLEEISDLGLGIWSWDLNYHQNPLTSNYRGDIYGDDLIKVIKSAKIGINIHREFEISGGNYRLFEITASKTLQIVDEKKNIAEYFKIEEEIITFKDKKQLRDKVLYYLKNEKEREEIAMASYRRTKKDHDLKDRIRQMIEIIKADK